MAIIANFRAFAARLSQNYFAKHYGYPCVLAVAAAVIEYLGTGQHPDIDGALNAAATAMVAFIYVRMNPKAGPTEPVFTPK